MTDLPAPVCADCVAFRAEQTDDQGRRLGACRFRPEMGLIRQDLPHCHVFQVRRERADQVQLPQRAAPVRSARQPRRSDAPANVHRTLRDPATGDTDGEITMDRNGLKQVLRELLQEETLYGYPELGGRWEGGTLVLKPADSTSQAKEVPLETFFHKIVMLRDRLRVLESKLNGSDRLSEQEKVEYQGYISKCYGTLTTFNVLFQRKDEQFRSK